MEARDFPERRRIAIPADIEHLAKVAIDASLAVHRELGPGLLEGVYEACLAQELRLRGVTFRRQHPVPLEYRGIQIEAGFRADFLLEGRLLLELNATDEIHPIHRAQVITYLKLLRLPLGLLLNFNRPLLKDGMERILNLSWVQ